MKELFIKGGPLVYVIFFFSILGLAVVIERFYYFFKTEKGDNKNLKDQIKAYIKNNDINGAKAVCSMNKSSVSKVIQIILDNIKASRTSLEEKIKEVALEQISKLERYMWILKTTGHVTPLLGLLGTVTGMMKTFNVIAARSIGNPEMLAGGISEALITTATGLSVAIPAVVLFNYFEKKIDNTIHEMEQASVEFLNILGR
ncbi:MAG: MotA/TolQ/ExbB proton channel family protein [Spirochaetes bacterium]|nr:MotA/TolQ/ExbB proton channel family protein [Spirochaetota bacterium]